MAFAACSNKEICHKTLTAQCINQAWCPHSGGTCEVPLSFHPLIMCMRVNGGGGWCVSSFQAALLTLTFHYIYDCTTADLKKKEKKKLRKPLDRCWSPTLVYVSLSWIMTFIVSPGDICVLTTLWSRSQKNTLKKISDFRSWHLKEEVVAVLFKRELTFLWTEYIQLTLEGSADRPEEWGPLWAGEEGQPEEMNPMKCYLQLMQK